MQVEKSCRWENWGFFLLVWLKLGVFFFSLLLFLFFYLFGKVDALWLIFIFLEGIPIRSLNI